MLPTLTFPNDRFAGVTETAGAAGVTTVALRAATFGEVVALLAMVRFPEALPVTVSVKVIVTAVDALGATVMPEVDPPALYPAPLTEARFTTRLAVPVFEIVMDRDTGVPTVTVPKEEDWGSGKSKASIRKCRCPTGSPIVRDYSDRWW